MSDDFLDGEEAWEGQAYDGRLLRWMLAYARPHLAVLAACVVLLGLLAGLELVQPFLIKTAIDRVLAPGAGSGDGRLAERLWPLMLAYLGSAVALAALQYLQALWLGRTGQSIIAAIRRDVFGQIQRLSLSYFDRQAGGRVVTRATNDVEALNEMYTSVLVNLFRDVFVIAGALILLLRLSPRLALVPLAAMPLVAVTAWAFQKRSRRGWRASRAALSRINANLAESFSGMRLIQAFGREAREREAFGAVNQAYYRASMDVLRVFSIFGPALDLLTSLSLAALLWYGGGLVLDPGPAHLGFGDLYLGIAYLRRLFEPINALAQKYNILQSALAAAERLSLLMSLRPEVEEPERPLSLPARADPPADGHGPASGPAALAFEDVWFAYQGEDWVLRGVSFRVAPGETVAFVGQTGAGKSTIMNLVPRFYDVQRGRIRLHGVDLRDLSSRELRRRVGIVMQDVFLFAGDLAENIGLGEPAIDRPAIERAAMLVGADRFIRALPGGLDEPVLERGLSLSTGQRQLISFARALAFDPELLILDEATASVDTETEEALQAAVGAVSRGRTTIIVAHRLATVRQADRIYVMHKGRIVEEGDHASLLARGGLYARLWRLQFDSAA